jgi:hypothetical protein
MIPQRAPRPFPMEYVQKKNYSETRGVMRITTFSLLAQLCFYRPSRNSFPLRHMSELEPHQLDLAKTDNCRKIKLLKYFGDLSCFDVDC